MRDNPLAHRPAMARKLALILTDEGGRRISGARPLSRFARVDVAASDIAHETQITREGEAAKVVY